MKEHFIHVTVANFSLASRELNNTTSKYTENLKNYVANAKTPSHPKLPNNYTKINTLTTHARILLGTVTLENGTHLMKEKVLKKISDQNESFFYHKVIKIGSFLVSHAEYVWKAFISKAWWNLRTTNSLWKEFMIAKYCKRLHPTVAQWNTGQSQSWKMLCEIKQVVEENLAWKIGEGKLSFWYDNWSGKGTLNSVIETGLKSKDFCLKDALTEGTWEIVAQDVDCPDIIRNLLNHERPFLRPGVADRPVWKANNEGSFTVASAWELLRQKRNHSKLESQIWQKQVPFKMAFIAWRAIHNRLPTEGRISRFGFNVHRKCFCCSPPADGSESTEHIFCSSSFAQALWVKFAGVFGVRIMCLQLRQMFTQWWSHRSSNVVSSFMTKTLPAVICWELWKSKCAAMYGEETPYLPFVHARMISI